MTSFSVTLATADPSGGRPGSHDAFGWPAPRQQSIGRLKKHQISALTRRLIVPHELVFSPGGSGRRSLDHVLIAHFVICRQRETRSDTTHSDEAHVIQVHLPSRLREKKSGHHGEAGRWWLPASAPCPCPSRSGPQSSAGGGGRLGSEAAASWFREGWSGHRVSLKDLQANQEAPAADWAQSDFSSR